MAASWRLLPCIPAACYAVHWPLPSYLGCCASLAVCGFVHASLFLPRSLACSWVPIEEYDAAFDAEYTHNAGKKAGINTLEQRVGGMLASQGCGLVLLRAFHAL